MVDHTGLSGIPVVAHENLLITNYSKVVVCIIKFFLTKDNNIFKVLDISRIETLSYPAKVVAFEN